MRQQMVLLDIGGSYVKYGLAAGKGLGETGLFPVSEGADAETLLRPIEAFLAAHPAQKTVVCMPGPMDYPTGTSLMKHKFVSLYGVSLKARFEALFPGEEFLFVHDGLAFMLGEAFDGGAKGLDNAAGVMLGTGLGFVLLQDGYVLARPVMSPYKSLWNVPYRDGIAEDYVSGRALAARYRALTGRGESVKDMAALARAGDAAAASVFTECGAMLGDMLARHLEGMAIEKIIIGGQISKAWDLMEAPFRQACLLPVEVTAHPDDSALRGAYAYGVQGSGRLKVMPE